MHNQTEYTVEYRNVKHPRLEYKTGTLLVILPKSYKNEKETLEKYRKWIAKKELTIRNALEQANYKSVNQTRTDKELGTLIHELARKYQQKLNVRIGQIYFRRMKTKWASNSYNGNLTINTLMKHLPESLIEYIAFHEIAHSIERKHNERFWRIVKREFPDASTRERCLFSHWFMIQKAIGYQKLSESCTLTRDSPTSKGSKTGRNL